MAQTVFLGMSGGVDSALAAALLVEQGYAVRGIYMRNWSRDLPGFKCTWADDLADAERVAVTLGIDLDVWDCERKYKETVVDYLVDAYAHGLTPNPDVMCNQTVKFGTFARRAFAEGADFVATGHYARVLREPATAPGAPARTRLLRAADERKDQTYFLWRVPEATLSRTLFPIGDIPTKAQVRRMCAERGLGVEAKPDSDGICFIGPVGIRTFLLDTLERRAGDIVEWETGRVIGHHDGAFLFTVGQRKGLVDFDDVRKCIDRLRERVGALEFPMMPGCRLTVSLGCVVNDGSYPDYARLRDHADSLMYEVKLGGKNSYLVDSASYEASSEPQLADSATLPTGLASSRDES